MRVSYRNTAVRRGNAETTGAVCEVLFLRPTTQIARRVRRSTQVFHIERAGLAKRKARRADPSGSFILHLSDKTGIQLSYMKEEWLLARVRSRYVVIVMIEDCRQSPYPGGPAIRKLLGSETHKKLGDFFNSSS